MHEYFTEQVQPKTDSDPKKRANIDDIANIYEHQVVKYLSEPKIYSQKDRIVNFGMTF